MGRKVLAALLLVVAAVAVYIVSKPAPSVEDDAMRLQAALLAGDWDAVQPRLLYEGDVDPAALKRFVTEYTFPLLERSRGEELTYKGERLGIASIAWEFDGYPCGFTYEVRNGKAYIWLPRLFTMTEALRASTTKTILAAQIKKDAADLRAIGLAGLWADGEFFAWEEVAARYLARRVDRERSFERARKAYSE